MNGPKKPLADRAIDILSALLGASDAPANPQRAAKAQGSGAQTPLPRSAFSGSFAPSCCIVKRPGASLGGGVVRPVRPKGDK